MSGPAFREGKQLELRPIEPQDYAFLMANVNTQDIRLATDTNEPVTRDDVASLVEGDEAVNFLVCTDGEPVGSIWLFREEPVHGRADLGYWMAEEARGNGYATAALELLEEYATDERRLRKLAARVFEGNEASGRVLEKAGFEQEGVLRDHYYVDGEHLDAALFGWFAE